MESVDNTPNVTVFEGGEPEGSIEKMEVEGGGASAPWPLEPVIGSDVDKVKFRYGTVHAIVPKIGAVPITSDLDDAANPEITATGAGVIYVKVDLAADTYAAENPVLVFVAGDETNVPADEDRVNAHHLLVGVEWDGENNSITNLSPVHQGSIDVASCAGVTNFWHLGG